MPVLVIAKICYNIDTMFKDRFDAGRQLAALLLDCAAKNTVVYALPRGGLILGYEIAHRLHCPLDIFVVKKIGHPAQEEYAIGAVAENGQISRERTESASQSADWWREAIAKNLAEAKARRRLYSGTAKMLNPDGKTAIVVDDGVATGLSMALALREIKKLKPRELICAVPVLPSDTAGQLKLLADRLVYLEIPKYFLSAVGAYYQDFDQIGDNEAIKYLRLANTL